MEKHVYTAPLLELVRLSEETIVTASPGFPGEDVSTGGGKFDVIES